MGKDARIRHLRRQLRETIPGLKIAHRMLVEPDPAVIGVLLPRISPTGRTARRLLLEYVTGYRSIVSLHLAHDGAQKADPDTTPNAITWAAKRYLDRPATVARMAAR